jgi:predicted transcriptional regulator
MVRIEQFLTELSAFRDDAHLAAWKSYESNGHAWDILTLLWAEKSQTLEEINSKLKRRGNSLESSRIAVEQLVKKGWAIQEKDSIRITPFGAEIRKIAEETTDRYYASPFKKFTESDLKKVIELTDKFRRSLPRSE